MELAIEKVFAILFLTIGLSHLVQPKVWIELFFMFRRQGRVGSFLVGFLHLPPGALIVSFHNVWHGIPLVLTLLGWGYVIRSLLRSFFPAHGLRMLETLSLERAWLTQVEGAFLLGVGALLGLSVLRS